MLIMMMMKMVRVVVEVLLMMVMIMTMMMTNITGQLITYNVAMDITCYLLNHFRRNHDVTILWDM